jgi:hypothetical protein
VMAAPRSCVASSSPRDISTRTDEMNTPGSTRYGLCFWERHGHRQEKAHAVSADRTLVGHLKWRSLHVHPSRHATSAIHNSKSSDPRREAGLRLEDLEHRYPVELIGLRTLWETMQREPWPLCSTTAERRAEHRADFDEADPFGAWVTRMSTANPAAGAKS